MESATIPKNKEPLDVKHVGVELFEILDLDSIWNETKLPEEKAEIGENDLLPFYLDFEQQWERVSAEMETEVENYSELFSEIVDANKEVAITQMNFHVSSEDILEGLTSDDALAIPKRGRPLKDKRTRVGLTRKRDDTDHEEGPNMKQMKEEEDEDCDSPGLPSEASIRVPGSSSGTTFVFVREKQTNAKKVIPLRAGEELPEKYEMASIYEFDKLPQPQQVPVGFQDSTHVPMRLTRSSDGQTLTSGVKTIAKSAPSTPSQLNRNTTIKPLSELMATEMLKKSTKLKYNQRSSGETPKVVSVITSAAPGGGILGGGSRYDAERSSLSVTRVSNSSHQTKPVKSRPIGIGTSTVSIQASSSIVTLPAQKPSLSVGPFGHNLSGADKKSVLLRCTVCGEFFPDHCDHLFRKHVFTEHNIEIIQDKYFEDSTVHPDQLLKCKKCYVVVLNNHEAHQKICLPGLTKETAFDPLLLSPALNWSSNVTYSCGVGECTKSFGRRYRLKIHIQKDHAAVAARMILDPAFRCAQCLKRFDDSFALGRHCATCRDMRPHKETILELAKSGLFCEFCKKNHNELSETTSCSLQHGIFRCVLCLAMFKEKKTFYMHLHYHHGLQTGTRPRLILDCPICEFGPNKYTVIFSHIVSEHFSPMLLASNQQRPSAPLQFTRIAPAVQRPIRVSDGVGNSSPTRSSTPVVITSSGNSQGAKRLPELHRMATTVSNANIPHGIIINTNRLSSVVTQAPTPATSTVVRTSASQVYAQNQIIILNPTAISTSAPVTLKPRSDGVSAPTTIFVTPTTTAQIRSGQLPTSVRQPISGLFKLGTQPPITRTLQVGMVRPQPIPKTSASPLPTIISRSAQVTTGASQVNVTTNSPTVTSLSTVSAIATPAVVTESSRPLSSTHVQAPVVTNAATVGPVIVTLQQRPPQFSNGTTTITPTVARGPERITVVRPPTVVSSVLTISHATPTVRNQGPSPAPTVTTPTTTNASSSITITATTGNSSTTLVNGTDKPNASPSKGGSRVISIGGRPLACEAIQNIHNKLVSNSQSITQSLSGATVARHSLTSDNFRIPLLPSIISSRPQQQQQKPK